MDISLSRENEDFIQEQIAQGTYKNINEAINAAISKMAISQEKIEQFNKEIELGLKDIKEGNILDGEIVMQELRKKYA